jgi:hypothetical protein
MSVAKILFIDDGELKSIIEKIKLNLRKKGYSIDETIIDLSQPEFYKYCESDPEKQILDFERIKLSIKKHVDEPFEIIACDYHYAGDELDGAKILSWLKNFSMSERKRIRKAKFCLYSSEVEKVAKKTNTIEEITKLIKIRLTDLYKRELLADGLSKLVLDNKRINLNDYLVSEMEKYGGLKFKSVYPPFKGKTFSEIAREIDSESHQGISFSKNLVDLSVAHFSDLNTD